MLGIINKKDLTRIYEDFIDIEDDIIVPEDVESDALDSFGYSMLFNLIRKCDDYDEKDSGTPVEIVVKRIDSFLDSFSAVISHTMPVALSVNNDDGGPVWLDEVTRPSDGEFVVSRAVNICFYADFKTMNVRKSFSFLAGLFNAANRGNVGYTKLQYYKRFGEKFEFKYRYLYEIELKWLAETLRTTPVNVIYDGFLLQSKNGDIICQRVLDMYNNLAPFVNTQNPSAYVELCNFIGYDFTKELTVAMMKDTLIYGKFVEDNLPDDIAECRNAVFNLSAIDGSGISYVSMRGDIYDEVNLGRMQLVDEKQTKCTMDILTEIKEGRLKPMCSKLYESPSDDMVVFAVYTYPYVTDENAEPEYPDAIRTAVFYITVQRQPSDILLIAERVSELFGEDSPYTKSLSKCFNDWFDHMNRVQTSNGSVNESFNASQNINEDYIDNISDEDIVQEEQEEDDDDYSEYDRILFIMVSYFSSHEKQDRLDYICRKKSNTVKMLSHHLNISSLVRSFSRPCFITDNYIVRKRSDGAINLVDSDEFPFSDYIAVVCGFNFREDPSPGMILRFLNSSVSGIVNSGILLYKIIVMDSRHRHIKSTLDSESISDLMSAFKKTEGTNKTRVDTIQAGLDMMEQFTESESFVYDYEKAIGHPLILQDNMMYKIYADQERNETGVMSQIKERDIISRMKSCKLDESSLFYATSTYGQNPAVPAGGLYMINMQSTAGSYISGRLKSEPIRPDVIELFYGHESLIINICVHTFYFEAEYMMFGMSVNFKPKSSGHISQIMKGLFHMGDETADYIAKRLYCYFR